METRTINMNNGEKNKSEMSKGQAASAAGIAGAVAGAGAAVAFDAYGNPVEQQVDPVNPVEPTPGEPVTPVTPNPTDPAETIEPVAPVEPEEPKPSDPDTPVEPNPSEPVDPDVPFTDPTAQDPVQPGNPNNPTSPDDVIAQNGEVVDVNQIADDIIAIEEIDPNDIDMEDVLVFEEVGVIYTEEGDIINMATFYDVDGAEYVLVDIDGDLYFDFVFDDNLMPVAEVGNLISVGDAESQIAGDLAHLEVDDVTNEAISDMDVSTDIVV